MPTDPAPKSSLRRPDPDDERLSAPVTGIDESGQPVETRDVTGRPLTL